MLRNGGYTDTQIAAMSEKMKTLPREEKFTFESLLKSMALLRSHGDFTTPGVLERHYGLTFAPKTCQGLHGACRYAPNHDGDCEVIF